MERPSYDQSNDKNIIIPPDPLVKQFVENHKEELKASEELEKRVMAAYQEHFKRSQLSSWRKVLPMGDLRDWIIDLFPKRWVPVFVITSLIISLSLVGLFAYNKIRERSQKQEAIVKNNNNTNLNSDTRESWFSEKDPKTVEKIYIKSDEDSVINGIKKSIIDSIEKSGKIIVTDMDQAELRIDLYRNPSGIVLELINTDGEIFWSREIKPDEVNSDKINKIIVELVEVTKKPV
ncbi:MAG: hypothetical protein AB1489_40725 [Acidobacteriota bacterium]